MSDLTVMIVDDEPLARRRLARMVSAHKGVMPIGEAEDVAVAHRMIEALRPDILLLDVQMPGASGFDLLDRLAEVPPVVIFVTAFDHHALRAFNVSAADYVTKPVDPGRFAAAINRAIALARSRKTDERLAELTETVATLRAALQDQDAWRRICGSR